MTHSPIQLEEYTLSPLTGFLAQTSLSSRLPEYYASWEDLSDRLPDLIQSGTIRHHVDKLELLSIDQLPNEGAWRRAYSLLSYLISAYVWVGDAPQEIVPEALATPYVEVCRHVEMPPVITYTGLILWNCRLVDDGVRDQFSLDNLDVCRTFTATQDERWFHMICAAIEAKAGKAITKLLLATTAADQGDTKSVENALDFVADTVRQLTVHLQKMHHRVDPGVWFHQLRPFLAGGIDERLPNGLSFDGGKSYKTLAGANAGQSSLFQFFDIALGIDHSNDFAARMRTYMPGPHTRFLRDVEGLANIRAFVQARSDEEQLRKAYDACLRELEIFRDKHIRIVSRYIVIPAREGASKDGERVELRGVGGAPLMPFLRGMRNETREGALGGSKQENGDEQIAAESFAGWAVRTIRAWVRYRS